jgi:hypothetical protein
LCQAMCAMPISIAIESIAHSCRGCTIFHAKTNGLSGTLWFN